MEARFFFVSSRRSREASVGRVALRTLRGVATLRMSTARRLSASARFCSWLRLRWALMRISPSWVMWRSLRFSRAVL